MKHTRTILSNGVRVITVPLKDNPTVTVMVSVNTGSYYEEPHEAGLSHFLEHMCFKGTIKRPTSLAITTELDGMGAIYNAFTSTSVTSYYAKVDTRHFSAVADIVTDIYKHSVFPEVEIEKEKGVVKGEIDMYSDEPQEKVSDALREHMYKGEPAERSILGTKETVDSFTRADLMRYRDLQYKGKNIVLTIAGGVSEEVMLSFARENFGDVPRGETRREFETHDRQQQNPETIFLEKDTDQSHLILAWRSCNRSHPDRYIIRVIRGILRGGMSSRLFTRLRDELGAGYYIQASSNLEKSFGNFSIATGTTALRVPEITQAILEETERLKTEPVPESELLKIKELIRSHIRMSLETSDGVADFFADQELLEDTIRTPEELDALFSAITAEDVQRTARELFNRNKITFAVIGKGVDKDAVSKALTA